MLGHNIVPRCVYSDKGRWTSDQTERHAFWQSLLTRQSHYTALRFAQSHSSDSDEGNIHQLLSVAS